ncbi:hypothetical protein PPYR_02226 [Photinus pyralis]|uniref:PHD-type domain-containing protein n=1 Tax=Photinus pyralis TaxID=7054 RepID=A0A1Y1LE50_PHOPY|nr:integrator complex subunit 12-like isoform X2 [Photinus pyralis]KAB0805256.1 hypothetical protein PPYR_02226 [Photinus pyralis]
MAINDLDSYYINAIGSLHSRDYLVKREPSHLQINLEEAIKSKYGITKDYGPLIATTHNRAPEEIIIPVIEESKATTSSSDNELELDLFNEDLMCIVCNGMDVAARNRLLECSDCHSLYHQECHHPPVNSSDADGTWTCQNCKDVSKCLKATPPASPSHAGASSSSKSTSKSSSQRPSVVVPKVHFNITKPAPVSNIMKKKAAKMHEKRKQCPR